MVNEAFQGYCRVLQKSQDLGSGIFSIIQEQGGAMIIKFFLYLLLIYIAVMDCKTLLISRWCLLVSFALCLLYALFNIPNRARLFSSLALGLTLLCLLLIISFIEYRKKCCLIGAGDLLLLASLSPILSLYDFFKLIFFMSLLALLFAVIVLLSWKLRKDKENGESLSKFVFPLSPCIVLALFLLDLS